MKPPRGHGGVGAVAGKALDGVANAIGRIVSGLADSFSSIFEAKPTPQRQAEPAPEREPEPQRAYQWQPPPPQPPRRSKTEDMLDEIRRTQGDRSPADELREELGRERERHRQREPDF